MLTSTTGLALNSPTMLPPLAVTALPATTYVTPQAYIQTGNDSPCCTPTIPNATGVTTNARFCTPAVQPGYNTGVFNQGGISDCCTPNNAIIGGVNPQFQQNVVCCGPSYQTVQGGMVSNGLCGPTVVGSPSLSPCCEPTVSQIGGGGIINPQYSTGGFCTPSPTGGVSDCCTPNPSAGIITGNGVIPTVSTGLCAPNVPGQPFSNCCAPSVQPGIVGGYNTNGFCSPSVGSPSNCCSPTVGPNGIVTPGLCNNTFGPPVLVHGQFAPRYCDNLCGPSVVGGNITDCFSPRIARPGVYVPQSNGCCGTAYPGQPTTMCCGPTIPQVPQAGFIGYNTGGFNTNACCGPSKPGQPTVSNCCGPTIPSYPQPGVIGYNNTGTVSDCCGPSVIPNGLVSPDPCGNLCGPTIQTPGYPGYPQTVGYNTGGFYYGPTGVSDCCEPNINSTYLIQDRARVRGGVVSKQVRIVQQIPNTTYISPQINSTIHPVLTPLVTQTYVTSPAIVQTSNVDLPQVNLNPTESLSPQAFAILQAISDQLPVSNLEIQFSQPVYLKQKLGIYVGQWVGDSMNGYGKLYFDNGGYFEGQFTNGIANTSNGCFIYPDGSYYIGAVANNYANGQGVYTYKNNTLIYKGTFVNDQPEGRGIEYYADQSRYEGDFRFGRKEGRGTFYWRDGTVYTGQFEGGFMQGYGVHKLSNGEVYQGQFRKNRRHGVGKLVNSKGTYSGGFRNDSKEGQGSFMWNDGRSYRGTFRNGKPDGPGVLTLANGRAVNCNWVNGVLDTEALDTSFGASQIGSFGAIGGASIIHNAGSVINNAALSLLQTNIVSGTNLGDTGSSLINNPFPTITSRIPAPIIPVSNVPAVTPLFGSRVINTVAPVSFPSVVSPIGSGLIVGSQVAVPAKGSRIATPAVINPIIPNVSGIGVAPVSSGVPSFMSGTTFNNTTYSVATPFRSPSLGTGLPAASIPVNPAVVATTTTPLLTPPLGPVITPAQFIPSPVATVGTTPFITATTPVSTYPLSSAALTPAFIPGSFGNTGYGIVRPPSPSPFLGGSLTPSAASAIGIGGFPQTTATTAVTSTYGIGVLPAGIGGVGLQNRGYPAALQPGTQIGVSSLGIPIII